jgi:hypothetical protein
VVRGDNSPENRRPLLHRHRDRRPRIDPPAISQPLCHGGGQGRLTSRSYLKTERENGAHRAILSLAAIPVAALPAALLLLTTSTAALLVGTQVL